MAQQQPLMELRTVQATVLKSLFDGIKEILMDINLVFTPLSIHCTAIDGSKSACVHFSLDTQKFEHYICTEDEIVIGINMLSFHKLIKPISHGDVILMRITRNDRFKLQIVIENSEKRVRVKSVLKLLDIDQQFFTIPDVTFDNVVTMSCTDFQRHCKDMITVSDKVTFACSPKTLTMKCYGDFADFIVEIQKRDTEEEEEDEDEEEHNDDEMIMSDQNVGTFSLKFINLFIKSSSLCTNVEIYLKQSYPLILIYKVGSLGKLQFVLAPEYNDDDENP
jgi:proliferating cell nuclear antigen